MNLPDDSESRATVLDLLSRASTVPCSTGAQAFASLVPSMSRFQVALSVLLPIIEETATHNVRVHCSSSHTLGLKYRCMLDRPEDPSCIHTLCPLRTSSYGDEPLQLDVAQCLYKGEGSGIRQRAANVDSVENHKRRGRRCKLCMLIVLMTDGFLAMF
jgi:hypothetical protein